MRTAIFVLSLFFVVWCFVSARWYVCGIKQLCEDSSENISPVVQEEIPQEDKRIVPLSEGPIQFAWSGHELIATEGLSNWRDSIFTLFDGSGTGRLVISGLYYPNEDNNSPDENLGLARAHGVAEWLMQEGFNYPIDLKSSLQADATTAAGQNVGILVEIEEEAIDEPKEEFVAAVTDPVEEVEQKPKPKTIKAPATTTKRGRYLLSSTTLSDETALDRQVQDIARQINPVNGNLLVIGHSVKTGDELADKKAGLKLASLVSELLIGQGISDAKILTESEGSDQTNGGRHSNRVEVIVQ